MAHLGLIAGNGQLPVLFAQAMQEEDYELTVITVTPQAETAQLQQLADSVYQIEVGQLDQIITTLQQAQLEQVIMLGKVTKELLYQGVSLDARFQKLLANLEEKNDDAIMLAIVQELQQAGLEVIDQTKWIQKLLPQAGTLTEVEPTEAVLADMEYGFKMAKEIGRLDIGQTVVVKDQAVMAVEAIEGTDQAILRGGELGQQEVVVAKVSKPEQDLRFDIPTIGLQTIEQLIEVAAQGLVIEANKTFIVKQTEVLKKANQAGLPIVALD
ncbi:LpxI family protein [Halanaerobaculum tunisiense]